MSMRNRAPAQPDALRGGSRANSPWRSRRTVGRTRRPGHPTGRMRSRKQTPGPDAVLDDGSSRRGLLSSAEPQVRSYVVSCENEQPDYVHEMPVEDAG